MSKIDNFPYPTPIFRLKFGGISGVDPSCWGLQSEMVRLISREIIFAEFQHHDTSTQRYRQTDRQLALASRGKKQVGRHNDHAILLYLISTCEIFGIGNIPNFDETVFNSHLNYIVFVYLYIYRGHCS